MKSKKIYRDEFEKVSDFLELCSEERINRSFISRKLNLGSSEVIGYTEALMELGYIISIDSGSQYAKGKMMYYKTTEKGNEFKRQIAGWVALRRKLPSSITFNT